MSVKWITNTAKNYAETSIGNHIYINLCQDPPETTIHGYVFYDEQEIISKEYKQPIEKAKLAIIKDFKKILQELIDTLED